MALIIASPIAGKTADLLPSAPATIKRKIAATSWKIRIAVAVRPTGQFCWWRSLIRRATTAVDDNANVAPTRNAGSGGKPNSTAVSATPSVAPSTWTGANPKISPACSRMCFSEKCRPISNSRKTKPTRPALTP
jgi:hypothetical protein